MKTKQLALVTFEQAEKLRESGFDWETTYYYRKWYGDYQLCEDHSSNFNGWEETVDPKEKLMSAPTVALALKWIRDEKNIVCHVITQMKRFRLEYRFLYRLNYAQVESGECYTGHDAAESALLDELLSILEKEKEQ